MLLCCVRCLKLWIRAAWNVRLRPWLRRAMRRDAAWDATRAAALAAPQDAAWDAAWDATRAAAREAAGDAAWGAALDATGDVAWTIARAAAGDAARAAAWDAASAAAGDAAWVADILAPVVTSMRESAFDLLDRMINV